MKGKRDASQDLIFRTRVTDNINGIVNRAETMACKLERKQVRTANFYSSLTILTRILVGSERR